MTTYYRVIFTASQKEVFGLLERNIGHEASVVAVSDPAPAVVKGVPEALYKPEHVVQRRKRRTKAQIEADRLAQAAE